jgi:hypothetical protein
MTECGVNNFGTRYKQCSDVLLCVLLMGPTDAKAKGVPMRGTQ